ncbi:acyltransferase family protein [Niveispirillum sp. KHB5.9]|uniref:acyltransferase family protein n=1 Tax=Niveispirillum sp. KHB5.9 TaxID=3400269 RepID=UPI003A897C25
MTNPVPSVPPASSQRLAFLDWVRVGAFGLLILYHVGMFYVSWDWHVKSQHAGFAIEPLMLLTNPWRLSLLFLISGVATRFMADRMGPGRLAGSRLPRLGIPLLFVMAVLVVPQPYYEVVEKIDYADGYWAFWGRYLSFDQSFCRGDDCLTLPTWNHMWFVAYLLVYTLIMALALKLGAGRWLVRLGEGGWTRGWAVLVLPILVLTLLRIFMLDPFPITHNLAWDWYNHAVSFGMFLLGFGFARNEALFDWLAARRWLLLGVGLGAWAFYAWYGWTYWQDGSPTPPDALRMTARTAYAVEQWAMILAMLGLARRYLNRSTPLLRYLSVGVFPFYIIHQTLIVVIGHNLTPLALPVGIESVLLIALTVAGCFVTYELARRIKLLGPLLGVR